MGGKKKQQAQRTKNNAKPSSSARSAELLGSSISQFSGVSGFKESGLLIPRFSLTAEEIDSSVDTNFQLVLKKMNKKDSTTKLKALQEFSELCKSSDSDLIKTILPFWSRIYSKLVTDFEHKVREAAHLAHFEVVLKVKRDLAPYLKQLSGAWFTAQYDTYPPAASAAIKAFNAAFPANKVNDAITFCQEEILEYIYDNVIVQTPQSLCGTKTTSTEDAEAKFQRVVVSSLQGYAFYLNRVPSDNIKNALEQNMKIITNQKFWKLPKTKVASIRSSWFSVISALCQRAPFLLESENAHVVGVVFSNLDESEPAVLPSFWEAVLSTITTIQEWWNYINIEKVVFNKLWKILREGGQGNASVIYPNLLPLLSHFPPLDVSNNFFSSFFENMRTGLKYKTAISSRSEAIAISTAFIECLQFVILRNQNDVALCERLIKNQLMASIEWSLTEPHASYKTLFNQISTVVQYWSRNVDNENVPQYKRYLEYFWGNLESLFEGLLMNLELNFETNAISDFANRQLELMKSLKQVTKSKKTMRVSFSAEHQEESVGTKFPKGSLFSEYYLETLEKITLNVCKSYVKFINDHKSKDLVQYLSVLLQDFENRKFLEFLNDEVVGNNDKSVLGIYENVLNKWLKDENLASVYVIDLIFVLIKHSNEEEKTKILNSLLEIKNEQVFSWCVQKCLSFSFKQCPIIQKWLQIPEIGTFLVEISRRIVIGKCSPELNLILKKAVEENENGDLFIADKTLEKIIEIFIEVLQKPKQFSSTLDESVRFCAHIAGAIYTEKSELMHGKNLLLSMFQLSCSTDFTEDILTDDTMWELKNVWQDIVTMLASELKDEPFKNLMTNFAEIFEVIVLNKNKNDNFNIVSIIEQIVLLIKSVKLGNPSRVNDVVHIILKRDFVQKYEREVEYLCKKTEYLKGRLSCPYKNLEEIEITDENNAGHYFLWSQLVVSVITATLPNYNSDDDDDDEEGGGNEEAVIEYLTGGAEFVVGCLYSLALGKSFTENFANTQYFEKSSQQIQIIKEKVTQLIAKKSENFISRVEDLLSGQTLQKGWLWTVAAYIYFSEIQKKNLLLAYSDLVQNYKSHIESELSILHLGQTFSKNLTYDNVQYDLMPLESVICLRSLIHCDEIDVQIAEVFSRIDQFKSNKKFLLESDGFTWEDYQITIESIRLFSAIIEAKVDVLSSNRWDFVVVAYASWLENLLKMKNDFKKIEVEALIAALSDLFISLQKRLFWLKENVPNAAKNTLDEWRNLFAADVHKFNIEIWLYYVDYYREVTNVPLSEIPLLQQFGKAILQFDYNYLLSKKDCNAPKWTKLVEKCCSILTHPLNTLQLWAYNLLTILLPGLVEMDSNSVNSNAPQATGLSIEQFKSTLIHTEEIVHSMLLGFRLGEDSCIVKPFTDSYTYTFAYLLLWDVILKLCSLSSTELRYQYADWIKNNDFLTKLLNNLFRLMPTEVLHQSTLKYKPFSNFFLEKFSTDYTENFKSLTIEHMVCWVYYQTLSQLPALVRQWWSVTESKVAQIVDRVTSVYVSPTLCSQELTDVIQHENNFKNMTVKVYPNVKEVMAVYTVDETQMELLITLPPNYPLKVPDIQCNKQICGTSHRQWILQLKTNVLHQNGRIWDGLSLWNSNLNKKFDGVEECYICFAVLHQGTYQLPKLSCRTCRKKFHSACLYKWFSTSNNSTCPICRNFF